MIKSTVANIVRIDRCESAETRRDGHAAGRALFCCVSANGFIFFRERLRPSLIGELHEEPATAVLVTTGYGGSRIVDMLVGDPLPRIC